MSALSNGPMKKSDNRNGLDDLGTGIAVARGYEAQVTTKIIQQEYTPSVAMSLPEEAASMEGLDRFIENSALPVESKEAARAILHEKLLSELEKGEEASVAIVKEQLMEITHTLPEIRHDLRSFIENYDGVSKTIRLVTHKLLD